MSDNNERNHKKIVETIMVCLRQLSDAREPSKVASIVVFGNQDEAAERFLASELSAAKTNIRCVRLFVSEAEQNIWISRFGANSPKVRTFWFRTKEDLLHQGMRFGEHDLLTVLDADRFHQFRAVVLADMKQFLKKKALILLEVRADSTSDWKQALAQAGFEGITARSERSTNKRVETCDLLIAHSDGQVQVKPTSDRITPESTDQVRHRGSETSRDSIRVNDVESFYLRAEGSILSGPALDREAVRRSIIQLLEKLLQLSSGDLDTNIPFTEFGVDSIAGVRFVNELNRKLNCTLKPTILFDYSSVDKLADYIAEHCHPIEATNVLLANAESLLNSPNGDRENRPDPTTRRRSDREHWNGVDPLLEYRKSDIAVIGISGRFPGADDVQEFWNNLAVGKNCITEVPAERWDHSRVYDPGSRQANKTNSKWGGFLADADKFDPLFFAISGREAEATDPQHRLFLEENYHALEDAGYAGSSIRLVKKCGVFVGVEPGDYLHHLMALSDQNENTSVFQGNAESILAARISYFLDLKGPSVAINTACSSSLVAIHLACQNLINGDCDLALAGGVRVLASERAHLALSSMGMLSPEGRCKTFDEAANGFVPGEAVGVLVLKSLSAARRDNDHIYGVIKGSAINQDGRTNGITAPSSISQTEVELEVYEKFDLNPESFQYVEAHGTGTKLGDPIEIEALTQAFRKYTSATGICGIGSVKTNIGHTMAAAGVCSVVKVLLSLQHNKIAPSLHLENANPYIDFKNSPFFVNTALRDWPLTSTTPRRCAVSSFGFSGTNSHLVIEEAPIAKVDDRTVGEKKPAYLVTLSAKTPEALEQKLFRLARWLGERIETTNIESVSFTLNAGRAHFENRCAVVASSIEELVETLARISASETMPNAWCSDGTQNTKGDAIIFQQVLATLFKELPESERQGKKNYREKLAALAALYTKGFELDLEALHQRETHRRISLPTYPFSRERYWISEARETNRKIIPAGLPHLHPLVHANRSTLTQIKFASSLDGQAFFLRDHKVSGEKILPGVAYLEIAATATRFATEGETFKLSDVSWMRPLGEERAKNVTILLNSESEGVRFEIVSGDDQLLHAQGKAIREPVRTSVYEEIASIRARCTETQDPEQIYNRCAEIGLNLGDGFRTIREIWYNDCEALSRLELHAEYKAIAGDFLLHPGLMDGALQSTAVLSRGTETGLPVPFAVGEMHFKRLGTSCYAHVRRASEEKGLIRFDVNLIDDSGEVLVELRNLTMRLLKSVVPVEERHPIYIRPIWVEKRLTVLSPPTLNGRLLLLDAEDILANDIGRLSPTLEILRAFPSADFSAEKNVFGIRPGCAEDFDRLLRSGPPDFVIHNWSSTPAGLQGPIDTSILPIFHLTSALIRRGVNAPTRLLLLHRSNSDPAYAAVAAYGRTLRQERPNLRLKVLETERAEALQVIAELLDADEDREVRAHQGSRRIKRLEVFEPELKNSISLRERGVYLISGGIGGLGQIFSRFLAQQFKAKLALLGRSILSTQHRTFLAELETLGAEVLYLQADLSRVDDVRSAVQETRTRFGPIRGVIQAAGINRDGFILNKSLDDFVSVMAPKVMGTTHLDEVTSGDPLDFFVLFSSMAAVLSNVGQSDYGYANCFLDEFARAREQQCARGERTGRTVSINWPLWRHGGMGQNKDFERIKLAGLSPLGNETGLKIFQAALRTAEPQLMSLVGDPEKIRQLISPPGAQLDTQSAVMTNLASAATKQPPSVFLSARPMSKDSQQSGNLPDTVLRYLIEQFSKQIKIPATRIRSSDPLEQYGLDSIMVMEFTELLEKDLGDLPKTLLFEYQTLAELGEYFVTNHAAQLQSLLEPALSVAGEPPQIYSSSPVLESPSVSNRETTLTERTRSSSKEDDQIAIIGVFGRYPMADDLDQFWDNLRGGRDCIVEIPPERWDYRLFHSAEPWKREPGKPGKTANKWGGFLNGVERFDAQFFNVTPREAYAIDPQERLFLETVWRTVEDAGYRKSALTNRKIGVFVGVMYGEYQLYGAGDTSEGWGYPLSSSYASIANRVSYFFNWHGPSMALDTMCSSSLTSIHLACHSLRRGESELAIAGGVNTTLHPHKDLLLNLGGFTASDGRCHTFGEGGDGYVPGEGVGAVLLKPLSKAIADGDHIYAVVKATTVNHGGKTNGYTVPNLKAQAELIFDALAEGNLDPRSISYIEAHGTGTALGDPIEIAALTKAFLETASTLDLQSCAIGSAKSNIGHLESAAGIAGLTKVLLQMQAGQIAPLLLHSKNLNPNINFAESIFYIPDTLQPWNPVAITGDLAKRCAGISSFGAGGSNAHVIVEEYHSGKRNEISDQRVPGPFLFILSANTEDRLNARAEQLLDYLRRQPVAQVSLAEIAYTLQVGREPLEERLAFVVSNLDDAIQRLTQFLQNDLGSELQRGSVRKESNDAQPLLDGEEGSAFLEVLIRQRKWQKLSQFWVSGGYIEWEKLYTGLNLRRVSLPSYPFAGERYWAPEKLVKPKKQVAESRLHPFVHRNISTFDQQAFATRIEPEDLVASTRNGEKYLPGLWLVEMGAVAARLSSGFPLHRVIDVKWGHPHLSTEPFSLITTVVAANKDIKFEIRMDELDGAILVQGTAVSGLSPQCDERQFTGIRERCTGLTEGDEFKEWVARLAVQGLEDRLVFSELWRGQAEVLVRFHCSTTDDGRFGACDLAPGLLNAALAAVNLSVYDATVPFLSPVSLGSTQLQRLPKEGWFHVALLGDSDRDKKVDITYFGVDEIPVVTFATLTVRSFEPSEESGAFFLRPVWEDRAPVSVNPEKLSGRLILFDSETALEKEIRAQHPSLAVTRVIPAKEYKQEDQLFHVDPSSEEDYRRLVSSTQPDYIIHRWVEASMPTEAALDFGVYSLFRITKALMPPQSEVRLLFCHPTKEEPAYEAVGAFAKTLAQEQPLLQLRVLHADQLNADALSEFFARSDEREIRREKNGRNVRNFEIFKPKMNGAAVLRQDGVYLITGGLGGVGRVFAEYLSRQFHARLILTGRSQLTDQSRAIIAEIENWGGRVLYISGDIACEKDAMEIVEQGRSRFGTLNGVIHGAGVLRDGFILKKERHDFDAVFAPKIHGIIALDEATKAETLDFVVLFSSAAGVFGNVGQADYSYANAFMDAFAFRREAQKDRGERYGRTVSINWPMWKGLGMAVAWQNVEAQFEQIGLEQLSRGNGIKLFEAALGAGEPQLVTLWGNSERFATFLNGTELNETFSDESFDVFNNSDLAPKVNSFLHETLADITQTPLTQLDSDRRFDEIGVDSIDVGEFNQRLERNLGPIPKTLLFEYPNIRLLARHLLTAFKPQLVRFFRNGLPDAPNIVEQSIVHKRWDDLEPLEQNQQTQSFSPRISEDIAIVGLSGRYPKAKDLHAFWEILKSGQDCVTEVPKDRWDNDLYFDPDPNKAAEGKIYSRWGAFLDDVDKFDPLFFNISPAEAELIDPQERLFLETAWRTLEDAGYTRRDLARWVRKEYKANVGVFVGVTTNTYSIVVREKCGDRATPLTMPWSLANRVSYLFNFNGPSIPVDTACSSSLTAIHLACEAIRNGQCQQAVAGGVNLYLHPSKYQNLCVARMLSKEGKCRAFGEGGDGFVPGEGVGAVLLKPLSLAEKDGDHIYAIIRGTAVNHGGRTNGYTVPNPAAQAEVISEALRRSGVDAGTLSYVEAHGTGTALGDPIEVAGLARAFANSSSGDASGQTCALGSVKTNIGHLEAAAGIAGLTKVLLQMVHGQLVPSLNADQLNANISFAGTSFRLQRTLDQWPRFETDGKPGPRRAGISSFGAGGANAHIVVEEYIPPKIAGQTASASMLILLSAKNPERLRKVALNLCEFLRSRGGETETLHSIAYTLQVGREAMEERVAFVTADRVDLLSKLDLVALGQFEGFAAGRVRREKVQLGAEAVDVEPDATVAEALEGRQLERLGELWATGAMVDWRLLWSSSVPIGRVSLPGYPFAAERYWAPDIPGIANDAQEVASDLSHAALATLPTSSPRLHPLLHRDESTLNAHLFASELIDKEVTLRDHRVSGRLVLPGAATLEMALAGAERVFGTTDVRLRQVVWMRSLVPGTESLEIKLHLHPENDDRLFFELRDRKGIIHVQGKAEIDSGFHQESMDIGAIRARCSQEITPEKLYTGFAERGLEYGPGFRVIQEIRYADNEVISLLETPAAWEGEKFRLHPALVDGALQSLALIGAGVNGIELPFTVDEVAYGNTLPARCYAFCQIETKHVGGRRYRVFLMDENGLVLARLTSLSLRGPEQKRMELFYCRPGWEKKSAQTKLTGDEPVLLLDERMDLAECLERRGVSTVRVVQGAAYERIGDVVSIRRNNNEDYVRLVHDVPFGAVIHRWSEAGCGLEDALDRGLFSVHRLAQALAGRRKATKYLYVYPLGEAAYEAISGYAKSLNQELVNVRLKMVGVDSELEDLLAEINEPNSDVRYYQGQREVRKLERWMPPVDGIADPLTPRGTYLITGGAGGLGMIFAKYLRENYDAHLVLAGRSELNEAKRAELKTLGSSAIYIRADVSTPEGARLAVREAKARFGGINGIIHTAGVLRDGLVRNKSCADMASVLAAKVLGVEALDAASCNESLDCFILFSSTAGLLGNAGQCDYAYANAYLDSFAHRRERLRNEGLRTGRTVSLNWPLWLKGGMQTDAETVRLQAQIFGVRPLETDEGLAAFEQILSSADSQCAIFSGTPQKLFALLEAKRDEELNECAPVSETEQAELKPRLLADIISLVGKVLRLDVSVIESDTETSEYGFDSISFTALANEVNAEFGFEITPALLFEYTTLDTFSDFIAREYRGRLIERYKPKSLPTSVAAPFIAPTALVTEMIAPEKGSKISFSDQINGNPFSGQKHWSPPPSEAIAIVGMSGVFPGSPDLDTFWSNLDQGKDLITRAPRERWNFEPDSFESAPDLEKTPWGGFISEIDLFDPLFFGISPREAELMDPQQRLFLQVAWHTLEDAGYKKSDLAGSKTGVFVGVAANDYGHLLAMYNVAVDAYSSTGNSHSVLANRVSYFLDLRGPSEAIDTACSSSLVAIHRAVESIASGSSEMAIVGGVNVLLSPGAFLSFGKAGMLSEDGRCKTFDARANGYVRGEGVGAILLKPLSRARRDRDHIYGVILGSAENHGGHVQSLTVPNPNAQADLLRTVYTHAGIDPFTIGYIEAHGTGTSLGDPIEINGLKKAFGENHVEVPEPRCAVGSVKTNIGHLETAAGIAGIIKVLLSMRYRRIPGNVHLQKLNPYIQVTGTPFHFPRQTEAWEPLRDGHGRDIPRRAGVSSFGFGGANAHILIEEFVQLQESSEVPIEINRQELFLFSGSDANRLNGVVKKFVGYLATLDRDPILNSSQLFRQIAYTLQVGRESMNDRLAVIASNFSELSAELTRFINNDATDLYRGSVSESKAAFQLLRQVHDDDRFLEPFIQNRELPKLARLWVCGMDVDWESLWTKNAVRRTRLPGYAFDRKRYWIPGCPNQGPSGPVATQLHPLLHRNESTLRTQLFGSSFNGNEVVFRDHQVGNQKVLPGAASLELALAAASLALETTNIRLRGVVWSRPIIVEGKGAELKLQLTPVRDGSAKFVLQSSAGAHVQGSAETDKGFAPERFDLDAIKKRCDEDFSPTELYAGFAAAGLFYGPAFQVIKEITFAPGEVLSLLQVPEVWGKAGYRLHPALVDGALQSLATIRPKSKDGIELPFAVDEVMCGEVLPRRCYAYGQAQIGAGGNTQYEVRLLNESGQTLARLKALTVRTHKQGFKEFLYYSPKWIPGSLEKKQFAVIGRPILLFDESQERAAALAAQGITTFRVAPGQNYNRSEQLITIRLDAPDDYARLIKEVPFAAVVHCWSKAGAPLDEALQLGVYSLHRFVQALVKARRTVPFAYVYPAGEISYEAVAGYAKSLKQEHPKLRLKTIGAENAAFCDLLSELNDEQLEVRYRLGQREVRALEPFTIPATIQNNLRNGGVYVVTGGAGGLGRLFANYLVQKYNARLVLVGRSELDVSKRSDLAGLNENAIYVRADVSTTQGVNQVLRETKERYGAIHGVIHAAGVLRDGLIWNKTIEDFDAVLAAKVHSVEALDSATRDEPLDCFIVFSSIASLFGNAGQSDYAFGNAYLDGFANRREEMRKKGERHGRTLSLNWPLWRDGGMQGALNDSRSEMLGIALLEKDAGLQIFEAALSSDKSQVWGYVGRPVKIERPSTEQMRDPLSDNNIREENEPKTEAESVGLEKQTIGYLIQQFAALTKVDPGEIRPEEALEKYGFDSIMAVEFSQHLERDFGELSKTLLFEYPSMVALADYLTEHHGETLKMITQRGVGESETEVDREFEKNWVHPETQTSMRFLPEHREELSHGSAGAAAVKEPAAPGPLRKLDLAPIDYLFVGKKRLAMHTLYSFDERLDFQRMNSALCSVTNEFFPINSQLVREAEDRYAIYECSGQPDFDEVRCGDQVNPPQQDSPESFEPFQVSFDPMLPGEKLSKFRLFQLARGSVLSVTVSHAIADGYSYYYFLSAWAAACRGESFLKPDHSRHILTRLARHYREKRSSNHSNGFALTNLSSLSLSPTINPMTSKIETLLLDGASLVAEARKGANQSMRNKITENSVLTASIWQIYARSLSPDAEQIELACPVDFRRISSELSRSYFGNASAPAIVRLTRDEVLNGSIPHLAALISEAVRDCNETTLARYCAVIDDLRLEQGLAGIDRITLVDPGTGLIVTNVARFPLAPIDFGTGPFIQEATPTNYAGTAVIVAGEGSTVKVRLSYPELVRS